MGTGFFAAVKSDRGVTLTPRALLVPWSWKGRAIILLPLWSERPVQSPSACKGCTLLYVHNLFIDVISENSGFLLFYTVPLGTSPPMCRMVLVTSIFRIKRSKYVHWTVWRNVNEDTTTLQNVKNYLRNERASNTSRHGCQKPELWGASSRLHGDKCLNDSE